MSCEVLLPYLSVETQRQDRNTQDRQTRKTERENPGIEKMKSC